MPDEWVNPGVYPYVDTNPKATCHWWDHGKVTVRTIAHPGRFGYIERYDCRCGKYYWLSQDHGESPIVRYRTGGTNGR